MRHLVFALLTAIAISGCSWETYQNAEGRTSLRQKYPQGTRIYYEDGTYSRNMRNNQFRPEQHAVRPKEQPENVRGTRWEQPANPDSTGQ
ncbi:spore cortex protein [Neisseria sp.]|mgnify:CR=1 FL=1|uniref:spore cortex protein n=1 Tax=Neisseria sp. TaxID=192066 RepID=UPI00289E7C1D|nr:spore cortex protein [Neisseria sp.]